MTRSLSFATLVSCCCLALAAYERSAGAAPIPTDQISGPGVESIVVPQPEDPDLLPHLVIEDTTYDFGTVHAGVPAEHRFLLRNTGKGALKILKMHTSCGCTAAVLDSDTIPPGGTTFVKAIFDTTSFQGPKVKIVRLYTNDPKQASFTLTIQGTIQPDVQVSQMRIRFGDVVKGQSPEQEVTATTDPAFPLKIIDVTSRSPYLNVRAEDDNQGGRVGKRVFVSLKPDAPIGVFRERVSLKTSSIDTPIINVPVLANIEGDIELKPSVLSFGVLDGPLKTPLYRDVQIASRTGRPVKVDEIESDNSSVSARLLQDGDKTVIRVTIGSDLEGAFRARLTIVSDTPNEAIKAKDTGTVKDTGTAKDTAGGRASGTGAAKTSNSVSNDSSDADSHQLILSVFGIVSRPPAPGTAASGSASPSSDSPSSVSTSSAG